MTARLTALGRPEGIDYRFDLARRVNTFDAHRLIAWSATQPAGRTRWWSACSGPTSPRARTSSDASALQGLAAEAGLDGGLAAGVLADGSLAEEVRADAGPRPGTGT